MHQCNQRHSHQHQFHSSSLPTKCIVYNAGTSNNYAVYHKYEKAGTYKVCAKILYSGGCISTTCKELKIEAVEECGADFKLETLTASGTSKQFIALDRSDSVPDIHG